MALIKNIFRLLIINVFTWTVVTQSAHALTLSLVSTIDVSGTDIINMTSDGTNLLVIHNNFGTVFIDDLKVFDLNGTLIKSFSTGTRFTEGIAWNALRGQAVSSLGEGFTGTDQKLHEINITDGTISGPVTGNVPNTTGMTFDGEHIILAVGGDSLDFFDATNYELEGIRLLTVPSPVFGLAWHNGEFFSVIFINSSIQRLDANLNFIENIPISDQNGQPIAPTDIAFVGDSVFVADRGANKIYRFSSKIPINIDISPNTINVRSHGRVTVAILTTEVFDSNTVDDTTVRFGETGTEAAPVRVSNRDVNGDGDADLILQFNTEHTGIMCGDTSAVLTGETLSGTLLEGSDSIKTVGCPK